METFLEFLREVFRGIIRAVSAHLFEKNFLRKEKTTRSRRKHKGGSSCK